MYLIVTMGEGDLKPRRLHWMAPIELQESFLAMRPFHDDCSIISGKDTNCFWCRQVSNPGHLYYNATPAESSISISHEVLINY